MGSAASVPVSGVAPGVMPPQVLGGPIWWFIVGVYLLTIGLSAYCLIDSFRSVRAESLAQLPEPSWLYSVFFTVFLVSVVGVWIPLVPRGVSVVPVLLVPFALALGVAYLLRIVFPKPPGEAKDGDGQAGDRNASET